MHVKELMEKATPLPWSVSALMTAPQYETAARAWVCPPPNGKVQNAVAGVISTPERGLPDAALIVHCVNNFMPLLEALEEMLEGVELCTPDAPDPLPHSIIGRARATIAAAKEVK